MNRSFFLTLLALLTLLFLPHTPDHTFITHAQNGDGILILNEICPNSSGGTVWVELINPDSQEVTLDGWKIKFFSGYSYTFPDGSGEVAGGDAHLLNITGENPLNESGDGCILIGPDGPVDIITWGFPPVISDLPLSPGYPLKPILPDMADDEEMYIPGDVLIRIPGTWSDSDSSWIGSHNWVYRRSEHASPGDPDNPFGPWRMSPYDGTHCASGIPLGVFGYEFSGEITFQVSDDENFQNIIIEETVTEYFLYVDPDPGTYYWRVRGYRPNGEAGPWSNAQQFIRDPFNIDEIIEQYGTEYTSRSGQSDSLLAQKSNGETEFDFIEVKVIGVPHIYQRKDTQLVCIDGCDRHGLYPWNNSHAEGFPRGGHNSVYCSRASLAMIACMNGNSLSQDRITYYIFEELGTASIKAVQTGHIGDPYMDLGHDEGTRRPDTCLALDWIYNAPRGTSQLMDNSFDIFYNETPEMDSIMEFVAADIPVIKCMRSHQTVIDGYILMRAGDTEYHYIHVVNPAYHGESESSWFDFPYPGSHPTATEAQFIFPPTTGLPMRKDEDSVWDDSDGDLLMDFDEINRFPSDTYTDDTDEDGLLDQLDMEECFFDRDGIYNHRGRDVDGDGDPKETDPDNDTPDNSGNIDGCEDENLSGYYDPENEYETNNFNVADDFTRVNSECFMGFIRFDHMIDLDVNDIPGAEGFSGFHKHSWTMIVIDGDELNTSDYTHLHTWGRRITGEVPFMTSEGSDSGFSYGKVLMNIDNATQEHTLYVDTLESWDDFNWRTIIDLPMNPMGPVIHEQVTPNRPAFRDMEIPLGVPFEENGGLVLRDEIDVTEVLALQQGSGITSIPGVSNILSWEIWLLPPTG